MKKQDVSINSIFFTYFGFGAVAGILFALLLMAISNTYIIHHDTPLKNAIITK
jgi:hypothetical protein